MTRRMPAVRSRRQCRNCSNELQCRGRARRASAPLVSATRYAGNRGAQDDPHRAERRLSANPIQRGVFALTLPDELAPSLTLVDLRFTDAPPLAFDWPRAELPPVLMAPLLETLLSTCKPFEVLAVDDVLPAAAALLEILPAVFACPAIDPAVVAAALVFPPAALALFAADNAPSVVVLAFTFVELAASFADRADELAAFEVRAPALSAASRERVAAASVLSRALPAVSSTRPRSEPMGSIGRRTLPAAPPESEPPTAPPTFPAPPSPCACKDAVMLATLTTIKPIHVFVFTLFLQ